MTDNGMQTMDGQAERKTTEDEVQETFAVNEFLEIISEVLLCRFDMMLRSTDVVARHFCNATERKHHIHKFVLSS